MKILSQLTVTDASGPYTGAGFVATVMANTSSEGVSTSLNYYSGTSAGGTPLSGAPTTVGTYTAFASFAGNADYTSAGASVTFSITKATPSVSVSDASGPYNGGAFVATDSVAGVGPQSTPGGSLESGSLSLTYYFSAGSSGTGSALSSAPSTAGTYVAVASFSGSADYASATASATFTIAKALPTVTVSDASGPVNGAAFTATDSVAGVGAQSTPGASLESVPLGLTYFFFVGSSSSGSALSGAPSTAGTYVAVASFAGSADYASAAASVTFTIAKTVPTVTVSDNGGVYNGSAYPATTASIESVTPSLTYYNGASVGGSALAGAPSTAGTYTAVASFAGSVDYSSGTASTTFTISKAGSTVSISDSSGAYNGAAFNASASVAGVGSQSTPAASLENVTPSVTYFAGSAASGSALAGAPSTVGIYTAVARFAGSTDYTSAAATTVFSISRATPSVTVTDAGGTFTGSPFPATTASIEGVTPSLTYYSGTSASGSILGVAPSTVGTYTALASFAGSSDYTSGTASVTFTIAPAAVTSTIIDFEDQTVTAKTLTEPLTDKGYVFTSSGLGAGASLEIQGMTRATWPGSWASNVLMAANWGTVINFAPSAGGAFNLTSLDLDVDNEADSAVLTSYNASGGVLQTQTFNFTGNTGTARLVTTETLNWTGVSKVGVTFYAGLNATGGGTWGAIDNIHVSQGAVTKSTPALTVTDTSGSFTDAAFTATARVNGVASVEGVTPSVSYYPGSNTSGTALAGAPTTIGTYTAVATFAGSASYTSASASTLFTISKAAATVTITDNSGAFNGAAFSATDNVAGVGAQSTPAASLESVTPSITYFSGTSASGSILGVAPSTVGTYTALASFAGSADYTSSAASVTFTISSASVTSTIIDFEDQTVTGKTLTEPFTDKGYVFTSTATGAGNSLEIQGTGRTTWPGGWASNVLMAANWGTAINFAPSAGGAFNLTSLDLDVDSEADSAVVTSYNASGGVLQTQTFNFTGNTGSARLVTTETVNWTGVGKVGVTFYAGLNATGGGTWGAIDNITVSQGAVTKSTPTLTVTDASGSFTDAAFTATTRVNGAASVEGVSPSVSYYPGSNTSGTALAGAPTTIGTYTAVATFAGSASYTSATSSTMFTISKAAPTVTVTDNSGAFNGAAFSATDSVAGVGGQSTPAASLEGVTPSLMYYSGNSASGSILGIAPSTVGTYTALASFAGSADYTGAAASVTFVISSGSVTSTTIDFEDQTVTGKTLAEPFTDKGYVFTSTGSGAGTSLEIQGPARTTWPGGWASNVLMAANWGTVTNFAPSGGGTFTLTSFDLDVDSEADSAVVTSYNASGGVLQTQTFNFTGNTGSARVVTTETLNWTGVSKVGVTFYAGLNATGGGTWGAVDNIHVSQGTTTPAVTTATASPFTNPVLPEDVLGTGTVTPQDALLMIDDLNLNGSHVITGVEGGMTYPAVDGTGMLDGNDVLMIVDYLNNHPAAAQQSPSPAVVATSETAATSSDLPISLTSDSATLRTPIQPAVSDAFSVPTTEPVTSAPVSPAVVAATAGSSSSANAHSTSVAASTFDSASASDSVLEASSGTSSATAASSALENTPAATSVDLLLSDFRGNWLDD